MGGVGAVGQAERLRLTRPGGHTTAAHRGRCALRAGGKRTLRDVTQGVWKTIPQLPAHFMAPLKRTLRNHRRGRRPRRPFRWMMDDVFAMRKRSPHAPTMGGLRGLTDDVISPHPRWYQPLSHGATRRDSSPFRGAEGWAEVCGVYASIYHDADTCVSHSPVRGGVLGAPRLDYCRGGLVADVGRGR